MIVVLAAVRFFVRLFGFGEGRLSPFKQNPDSMAEKMIVGRTAKAQPVIVRCCLRTGIVSAALVLNLK